jgi:glucan phosphoethanolaminetransferase (alkaline phosphatase superfamily)
VVYIVFNSLFLVAYPLSAAVQYNDPDPWSWVALYLAAALMCIAWFRKRLRRWYAPVLLLISLVWIGTLLPAVAGKVTLPELFESLSMRTRSIEEAREIGGLLLVAIWSAVLMHRKSI